MRLTITSFGLGGVRRGDVIVSDGKRYKITRIYSSLEIDIRRTFPQWARDVVRRAAAFVGVGALVVATAPSPRILDLGGWCCGTYDGVRCEVRPMQPLGTECTCPGGAIGKVCR